MCACMCVILLAVAAKRAIQGGEMHKQHGQLEGIVVVVVVGGGGGEGKQNTDQRRAQEELAYMDESGGHVIREVCLCLFACFYFCAIGRKMGR